MTDLPARVVVVGISGAGKSTLAGAPATLMDGPQVELDSNRESFQRTFLSRDSILLWVITAYHRRRREYAALRASGAFPGIEWIELRGPAETRRFLRGLRAAR